MLKVTIDRSTELVAMAASLSFIPGSRIWFKGEHMPYTVQARSANFLVCTKPFAPRHTVIYTIVDIAQMIRGTENLVFGGGFETRELCEEAIERLTRPAAEFPTKVSYRNRVKLEVTKIQPCGERPIK
ncbi:MAG: hypothetical protein E6R08_06290 [Nevskiaceae bacterium]|nr:MAG: hypothetical protein E6R08_06290 [Nevskiaceae bacterium]